MLVLNIELFNGFGVNYTLTLSGLSPCRSQAGLHSQIRFLGQLSFVLLLSSLFLFSLPIFGILTASHRSSNGLGLR